MGLSSGEVPGNTLDLLFSGVVLYPGAVGDSTADYLCVYLPGTEQATPPRGRSEPSESELLGGKLPFYSSEVTLPLEFTVDPDAQKPGLLDGGNYLLVEVNGCRGSCVGAGKVDKFTLFWSKTPFLVFEPIGYRSTRRPRGAG